MVFYGQQILKAQTQMRAAFSDINKDCRATLYVGISRFRANAFFPLIWKLYHPSPTQHLNRGWFQKSFCAVFLKRFWKRIIPTGGRI